MSNALKDSSRNWSGSISPRSPGFPRCSKHESRDGPNTWWRLRKKLGLEAKSDKFGNVVAKKPASAGHEGGAGPSRLQGHLDMVCEKNKDKVARFLQDPIELVRKGQYHDGQREPLSAPITASPFATNLAIMEDRSIEHGPLEFLFTVDEETGLTGASNLAPGFLDSTTLMNLDSEEEGALYVGCSGGRDTAGTWKLAVDRAPAGSVGAMLKVTACREGTPVSRSTRGGGTPSKIINRVLLALAETGARMCCIEGGTNINAIPREAQAMVFFPPRNGKTQTAAHEPVERHGQG